jgi:hypothetical protein
VEFSKFYNCSPEKLDLEAIRQYQLHLLHEKKLSPESINTFISSVQFLSLHTLEMPWDKSCFPRIRLALPADLYRGGQREMDQSRYCGGHRSRTGIRLLSAAASAK